MECNVPSLRFTTKARRRSGQPYKLQHHAPVRHGSPAATNSKDRYGPSSEIKSDKSTVRVALTTILVQGSTHFDRFLHSLDIRDLSSALPMHHLTTNVEEQLLVKAIQDEVSWEDLPKRLKLFLNSKEDWHRKIKDYCIKRRLKWNECHARSACRETEYYEELMRYLRKNLALFPYHLSENVCRVMRVSPFRYYCDMLYEVMKNERPYDCIPNFSAADVLRLTGIGRNEFIDIMNKCRGKKFMWKVNKSIVKEMLPTYPMEFSVEPWWTVCVVNLSLEEYRKLSEDELAIVDKICKDQINLCGEFDPRIVRSLYRRGLVYFDVPVFPDDRFQVLNLEGFVSNREQSYEDPVEEILYAVFVASSDRSTISELATTLQLDLNQLQAAVSVACRLGWANKALDPSDLLFESNAEGTDAEEAISTPGASSPARDSVSDYQGIADISKLKTVRVAFLVDATLTSYLMMGSFSPGLKNHAVTLYEAGKLGDSSIAEFCSDLKALKSTKLEGELQQFVDHALSLRYALECLRSGGTATDLDDGQQSDEAKKARSYKVDVLRCESLASLASGTLQRIFQRDYNLIVSMVPLTTPPLIHSRPGTGPVHFGPPSPAAATPWMKLLLYSVFEAGPVSVVLLRGLRLRFLPPPLAGCSKALVWTWDGTSFAGIGGQLEGSIIPGGILLHGLNSILRHSAVLVQPFPKDEPDIIAAEIPLPVQDGKSFKDVLVGCDEERLESYRTAADELQLRTIGYIRFLRVRTDGGAFDWVPQSVEFGIPLSNTQLCKGICEAAVSTELLDVGSLANQHESMQLLKSKLHDFIAEYQANGPVAREVYTGQKQVETGGIPQLSPSLSVRWNPFSDNHPEVESPSSKHCEPRRNRSGRRRRSQIMSFDGDILRSFSLAPVVETPSASKEGDFEFGEVPLPSVNLFFDGTSLVPLDIGPCLQARLAPALVAQAAAATQDPLSK